MKSNKIECLDCGITWINFPDNKECWNCWSYNTMQSLAEEHKQQLKEDWEDYNNLIMEWINAR